MPATASPTKLSPEEKARLKAEQAAAKARLAQYKKVAKILKSKDAAKRNETYIEIHEDIALLTTLSSNCLEALISSLVPNKKNKDIVEKGIEEVLWFLNYEDSDSITAETNNQKEEHEEDNHADASSSG